MKDLNIYTLSGSCSHCNNDFFFYNNLCFGKNSYVNVAMVTEKCHSRIWLDMQYAWYTRPLFKECALKN